MSATAAERSRIPELRVLLVEDDDLHAALAEGFLVESGLADFTIERAVDGAGALRLARDSAHDALILDFILRDVDGLTVLEQLRAAGVQTPALILTNAGAEQIAARALRLRADDYLPKEEGFSGNVLARAVLNIVERRRLAEMAEAEREKAARLEGVLLAARTMEHYLNNQLARTVAHCEMLTDDPRLLDDLRAQARDALDGALTAAETLRKLRAVIRLEQDQALVSEEIIDLDRSITCWPDAVENDLT